jgi:hypothetical protein
LVVPLGAMDWYWLAVHVRHAVQTRFWLTLPLAHAVDSKVEPVHVAAQVEHPRLVVPLGAMDWYWLAVHVRHAVHDVPVR